MSARIIRLKKEVRALFWPWCATVLVGASPMVVSHNYAEPFSFISFFIGVPLLATLSFGNEFHHRTLSLWLSQPLSRRQLWAEKMSVMFPAVLSAALVSGIVMFSVTWPHMRLTYKALALIYVVVVMASATYWTLATRSTLGSLALISFVLFFGMLFSGGVDQDPQLRAGSTALSIALFSTFGACFAAFMLWLGLRKLARFQVRGGGSDADILTSGPALAPEALARWLRPRPTGAFLNLLRKEFRLLRPLWIIALLVVAYVACLAAFRLLPAPSVPEPRTVLEWTLLGPLVSVCIAMAGLAGILSLGEERTSGTLAWHMTLPISSRRQWLLKLVMAMFAGLACSAAFPVLAMMAGGAVYGSPLMYLDLHSLSDDFILFAVLTFACFWCACAACGTVRAALWAAPVTALIALACAGGLRLGEELAQRVGTLCDFVVSSFHLSPLAFAYITDFARGHFLWLFVPTLLFALFQSYWLFRAPSQSSVRWMLRCLLPLAAVTIFSSFSASAGFLFSRWEPFEETRQAIDRFQPATSNLELTAADLVNGSSLSPFTQRWLRGSRITVTIRPSPFLAYLATIHLSGGLDCRLTVARSGGTAASCGN
jgi:ABC-type transport system involved in multi-copper enzyme maturation permease subunit